MLHTERSSTKPGRALLAVLALAAGFASVATACKEEQKARHTLPTKAAAPAAAAANGPADGGGAAGTAPAADAAVAVFYGTTEPHQRSTLTPAISGIVADILVTEGQFVKTGDALVQFDRADIDLRMRAADAAYQAAKVQVDATQIEWNRARALVDDAALPKSQFDMADAHLKGAKAGVAQAEVGVAMARKAIQDTVVRAPYDAVVTARHVSKGEYAAMMPPKPLLTIEDIETLDLRIQIPATEMAKVQAGDRMAVAFPAIDKRGEYAVTRIIPSLNPMTRSFAAVLEIANADHALRPGLFAEVRPLAEPPAAPAPNAAPPAAAPGEARP